MVLALAGCGKSGQPDSSASTSADSAPASDASPTILTTVGSSDTQLPSSVKAAEGTFALATPPAGLKRLMVNGKPSTYNLEVGYPAQPIEANDDLQLVGVIELPHESVAWATITAGTACPATHVLVSIKDGLPLNGIAIPGCDDRGTMRKVGDHIVFEVGGSTGTYRAGQLSLASRGDQGVSQ